MREHRNLLLVALCLALLSPGCGLKSPAIQADFAFVGVDVVDVRAGTIVPDQIVAIADGRISAIGGRHEISLVDGVTTIDGSEKFLAPGLMDMHVHVFNEDNLVLFLANGVTTVRNMWGGANILALREDVATGRIPGPRILTAGHLLDGAPKIWAGSTEVSDAGAVEPIIARQAADGYDVVKIYTRMKREVLDAILTAARVHDIDVAGHVPEDVPFRHAVEAGMRTTEHLAGVLSEVFADETLPNPDMSRFDDRAHEFIAALGRGDIDVTGLVDPAKLAELGKTLAGMDTWLVPTMNEMKDFTDVPRPPHPEIVRFMTPVDQAIVKMFGSSVFAQPPEVAAGSGLLYHLRGDVLRQLHEAGARFLVGTDDAFRMGFVIVDEMEALVEAGLPHDDVIRAATLEPARYMREVGQTGEVVVGAVADLILIEGNPFEDLDALRLPAGVMRVGVWRARAELDQMLEAIAAKYAASDAVFARAPTFPPEAGLAADFLSQDGAVRIASTTRDGITTVTSAISAGATWTTSSFTIGAGSFVVEREGQAAIRPERTSGDWQLHVGDAVVGTATAGDVAAVITGTPADILILDAAVGLLAADETRELVLWRCGPTLDCAGAKAEPMMVMGVGTEIINGHKAYESTNAYRVRPQRGRVRGAIDYWVAPPGLFSGGPVRIEVDGLSRWHRVR